MDYSKLDINQLIDLVAREENLNKKEALLSEVNRRIDKPVYKNQLPELGTLKNTLQESLNSSKIPEDSAKNYIDDILKGFSGTDAEKIDVKELLKRVNIPSKEQVYGIIPDAEAKAKQFIKTGESLTPSTAPENLWDASRHGMTREDYIKAAALDAKYKPVGQYSEKAKDIAEQAVSKMSAKDIDKAEKIREHLAGKKLISDLKKMSLTKGMDPSIKTPLIQPLVERVSSYLSKAPVEQVLKRSAKVVPFIGPALGAGVALATGDASAAMPMGFESEEVGKGSDITPKTEMDKPAEGGYMSPERLKRLNNLFKK